MKKNNLPPAEVAPEPLPGLRRPGPWGGGGYRHHKGQKPR